MRTRGVLVISGVAVAVVGASAYVLWPKTATTTPEQVAHSYFTAWGGGDLAAMRRLVADPPSDFTTLHRMLSDALSVQEVRLTPSPVQRLGADRAQAAFTVTRRLSPGEWSYPSTLRLAKHGGTWRVDWTPDTLFPGLVEGSSWRLDRIDAPAATAVARDGKPIPDSSTAQDYLPSLAGYGGDSGDSAWAIVLVPPSGPPRPVKVFGKATGARLRTTLDRRVQAAADAAVKSATGPSAIVAIRPSTGEILALGDRLGSRNAVLGLYPPGSTFKVITATGLVGVGLRPGSPVQCPHTIVTAQRTINNDETLNLGATTLTQAFAKSCNTTFAQLAVDKLSGAQLAAAGRLFGFGLPIDPGVQVSEGAIPGDASGAALAEAAIGQGTVQASPLDMAMVASAVADGEWRPPRLVAAKLLRGQAARPHAVPGSVLGALRPMMRAVVTSGTAARAGLPPGVYGKTGTAEYDNAGHAHAWFIGYRGDLAFAVFVQGGESGPKVAAPLAAKFLSAL